MSLCIGFSKKDQVEAPKGSRLETSSRLFHNVLTVFALRRTVSKVQSKQKDSVVSGFMELSSQLIMAGVWGGALDDATGLGVSTIKE